MDSQRLSDILFAFIMGFMASGFADKIYYHFFWEGRSEEWKTKIEKKFLKMKKKK